MQPFEWGRLLWGNAPLPYAFEILFRTLIIYLFLLLMLRMLSRRTLAQLSVAEFAIVIALGSAVGDPMFYEDVPLLHGLLVIGAVVGLQKLHSLLILHSEKAETYLEGRPIELVRDGVILLEGMRHARFSQEELFEQLRVAGLRQLGQVQRAYIEQSGQFSVIRPLDPADPGRPGLPFVPPWDLEPPRFCEDGATPGAGDYACTNCGTVRRIRSEALSACPHCGERRWTHATLDPLTQDRVPG
nr:YetF domain-containing protein [Deinobacterium chartae]